MTMRYENEHAEVLGRSIRSVFQALRSPDGEDIMLDRNLFVERVLPGSVLLADDEMDSYRAPYSTPGGDRSPTLTWPCEVPIEGEPADVVDVVTDSPQAIGRAIADWYTHLPATAAGPAGAPRP